MGKEKGRFGGLFAKKRANGCAPQMTESTADSGSCGGSSQGECSPPADAPKDVLNPSVPTIKVLGTGCKSCVLLEQNVRIALSRIEAKYNLVKVTALSEIITYGIVATPGLVVEGEVVSCGKVLKPHEIARILENIS